MRSCAQTSRNCLKSWKVTCSPASSGGIACRAASQAAPHSSRAGAALPVAAGCHEVTIRTLASLRAMPPASNLVCIRRCVHLARQLRTRPPTHLALVQVRVDVLEAGAGHDAVRKVPARNPALQAHGASGPGHPAQPLSDCRLPEVRRRECPLGAGPVAPRQPARHAPTCLRQS